MLEVTEEPFLQRDLRLGDGLVISGESTRLLGFQPSHDGLVVISIG